jgi:transposase
MTIQTDRSTIYRLLSEVKTKQEFERILCVWLKMALSLNSKQIASAIAWTPASVRRVQARFVKEGVGCFARKPSGGRKRANISLEREKQILAKFVRQTRRGVVLNVQQIKQAYELSAGKRVSRSTIYRLIERHALKRFLPRARSKLPEDS